MLRRIIRIDKARCNGCGLCAKACHEGAIGIVEGKATLLREDYCDGLGCRHIMKQLSWKRKRQRPRQSISPAHFRISPSRSS